MDYFKKLQELLKIERNEDRDAYLKLTSSTSVTDRRAAGLCWYPISIIGTEPTRGDYLNVEIERKTHLDIISQIRFGSPAVLFSNHDPSYRVEGVISYQNGNRLKINLFTEELPDWSKEGKLGVELLFDDYSYDDMQAALKQASTLKDNRLVDTLIGLREPVFAMSDIKYWPLKTWL